MKNKFWLIILAIIFVSSLSAGLLLMGGAPAGRAEITSNGQVIRIVNLAIDQEFTVDTGEGTNTVTVLDGKIAVTAADCPDHYCMDRGFCNSGTQIVCLPNRLVIRFLDENVIDGLAG